MKSAFNLLLALLALASYPAAAASPELPATTRKIVFVKTVKGLGWQLTEGPVAAVGDAQVLVHVRAVALNRGDLEIFDGDRPRLHGLRVGSDAAGVVLAVGKQVRDFKVGQRVVTLYFHDWVDGPPTREKLHGGHGAGVEGVLAEYLVIDATALAPAPQGLSFVEAAALPTAGLTAWNATLGQRALGAGDVVVVQGTGGVSTFALQFASAAGARVIVTSSSDQKLERARRLGASEGINYRATPKWSTRVRELTDHRGADLIVDVGGNATLEESANSIAYQGVISIVGGLTGYEGKIPAGQLLDRLARAQGVYVGSRADFLKLSAFITRHELKPLVDKTFALADYEAALAAMAANEFMGKIVLTL
jgi:NADPH:quinone reductase-like Zn-dependent oxidoreductase